MAQGQYKNKAYSLRMPEEIKNKIKIIADNNERTLNTQIIFLLKNFISEYESQFGEIKIDIK